MRSPFFFELSLSQIGFNWWYVVGMVFLAFMAFIGWNTCGVGQKGEIRTINGRGRRMIDRISVVMAMVFSIIVGIESHRFIMQIFRNALGRNESVFWADLFALGGLVAFGVVAGFIFKGACHLSAHFKHRRLTYYGRMVAKARGQQ